MQKTQFLQNDKAKVKPVHDAVMQIHRNLDIAIIAVLGLLMLQKKKNKEEERQ